MRSRALVAVVLSAVFFASCSDPDISRETFADGLYERLEEANPKVTRAHARCITDALYDEFSQEELNDLYVAEELEGRIGRRFGEITEECELPRG